MESLEAKVAKLEQRVTALEKPGATGGAKSPGSPQTPKDAVFLERNVHWADAEIRKEAKDMKGPSCLGFRPSDPAVSAEGLDRIAGYLEWCAARDAVKPDARKNSKGKFWWETDLLMAAVYRGWAIAKRDGSIDKIVGRAAPAADSAQEDEGGDDIPF